MASGTGFWGDNAFSIEPNTMSAMKPMPNVFNARLKVFEDELTEQGINNSRCYVSLTYEFSLACVIRNCQASCVKLRAHHQTSRPL